MDIDRATAYIRARGTVIEKARMASLQGKKKGPRAVHSLERMQNADGGFSYWLLQKNISAVCDTVYILSWIHDLIFNEEAVVTVAVRFFWPSTTRRRLGRSARNRESTGVSHCGQNRYTSLACGLLCALAHAIWVCEVVSVRGLSREFPTEKSGKQRTADRLSTGDLDALPIFNVYPEGDYKPFKDAFRVTVAEFTPEQWSGSYLVWLLECLRDAKIDRSDSFLKRVLSALVRKQRQDGSWDSEDGEDYAVSATLESIRVLKDFGLIPPSHHGYANTLTQ